MKITIEANTEAGTAKIVSTSDPKPETPAPPAPEKKLARCALIVGHRRSSRGAISADGTTEWDFNRVLAGEVKKRASTTDVQIVYRDDSPRGYSALPTKVNEIGPDFAVSMHFNSFEERPGQPEVSGTEVLHYPMSEEGIKLSGYLLEEFLTTLELPSRGLKGRGPYGRGGPLLTGTRCPTALAEPFFGDNPHDWQRATSRREALAQGYANALDRYSESI